MDEVYLVKVPLVAAELARLARSRRLPLRDLDDGYLCHWVTRASFGDLAPAPFVLRNAGRILELWGYSTGGRDTLADHASAFADPSLLRAIGGLDAVASKRMPHFDAGRRLGFLLRACPVARLARAVNGHRAGAEVDAFLARCFGVGFGVAVNREEVYREWVTRRFADEDATGVRLACLRVEAMVRDRLVRRTQGPERRATHLERPDIHVAGDLTVVDGGRLLGWLRRGIGRHRAFGFGAVMIVPPGTGWST